MFDVQKKTRYWAGYGDQIKKLTKIKYKRTVDNILFIFMKKRYHKCIYRIKMTIVIGVGPVIRQEDKQIIQNGRHLDGSNH